MTAPSPRSAAPAEALVARFKAALERLWPEGGKLGLAVSGGPDSLAMLLLAEAAIPGQFEVATVDHGLRHEAADECAMVARVCAERGIPCKLLEVRLGHGNVQARARHARYGALTDWAESRNLSAIATAHHMDDQAETFLMRANRGSGVQGLAGIRETQEFHWSRKPVIRPLLPFRRNELAELVTAASLQPVRDPSNEDGHFDRVRIRKALRESVWLDVSALASSASHLADAEIALGHYEQLLLEHHAFSERDLAGISKPNLLSREGQLRLARWALGELNASPDGGDLFRLVQRLRSGKAGNLAGVLATIEGEDWVFRPEPPRRLH
jgi:tRNA(Ile)-lysidine synthase